MASPTVDTRKLKDQAAELLGKSKYDKAADLLEQLVRAEPKEMQHRLKLGDTYRRLGITEKAINCYQIAGRHFGDEGQLIKAIGAFKVILEIDPKNEAAQKDLAQMNTRRFAKPSHEAASLKAPKAIGAGARAVSELELAEGEKAAAGISALFEGGRSSFEMATGADDAPLELDVPTPGRAPSRPAPAPAPPPAPPAPAVTAKPAPGAAEPRRGPPPRVRPSIEIGRGTDLSPLGEPELELPEELEPLDEDMPAPATAPSPSAAPSPAWRSGASAGKPAPIVPPAPALSSPSATPAARKRAEISDEIELDSDTFSPAPGKPAPAAPSALASKPPSSSGRPRPIADLLVEDDNGSEGEEIELDTIPSEDIEELQPEPAAPSATAQELDDAFDSLLPPPVPPPAPRRPAKVPLFDDLPQQAFLELVNRLTYKRWSPGEVILREGDPGRSFFVIVEGTVRVYKALPNGTELPLATLGEGAFFGEMALLSGAPRTANVAAETETELLEISDQMLREIVGRYPSVAKSLKNFYRQRLVNNVMAISPMFKEFDPGERRSIVERFKMKQVAAGEALIHESQQSDGLYVVLHGAVRVAKKLSDGREIELARLKEGEVFGEMSLLTNEPATATVSATGPTILLKLPSEQFQELILTHPQILEMVSDLTDQRRSHIASVLEGHGPGHDGMSFV